LGGKVDNLVVSAFLMVPCSSETLAGDAIVCLLAAGINISAGIVCKTGLILGALTALGTMVTSTTGCFCSLGAGVMSSDCSVSIVSSGMMSFI
jgi:hypothetical protein